MSDSHPTMSDTLLVNLSAAMKPSIIKVIGVGGGGGNAVARMYADNIPDVRCLVCNTDAKALGDNPVPEHLQLGPGLGAGGKPEVGNKLAEDNVETIRRTLDDETRMLFITAGMGGGTGTGASPVIAREARAKGILTVGIVTIPFLWERERQIDKALDGLEALAKEVDAMLVINNERLRDIYPDLSIIDAFRRADETLSTAVRSITEIIQMHGHINLDFEDARFVLTQGGVAVMSTGYGEGENRVTQAINEALHSPLLNNNDVYRADRLLLSFTISDGDNALSTREMDEVTAFTSRFTPDLQLKWGLTIDPSLGKKVKVTVLASGFSLYGKQKKLGAPPSPAPPCPPADPQAEERRSEFYENIGAPRKRSPRIHLFTAADLQNEHLLAEVENTPTYRRTQGKLNEIINLSKQ